MFDPFDPNVFVAGASNLIAVFDLMRDGDGPVLRLPTARGRSRGGPRSFNRGNFLSGGGEGLKGIISAMAIDPVSHLLAAGAFSRNLALYDSRGQGAEVTTISLKNTVNSSCRQDNDNDGRNDSGTGVTQLHFLSSPPSSAASSSSPYLLVTERESTGISLFDIRNFGSRLSWLSPRAAHTKQRLAVDVAPNPTTGETEVFAGGTDGYVRVWGDLGMLEGVVKPTRKWKASGEVVSAVGVHPPGAGVVVTGSGSRREVGDEEVEVEEKEEGQRDEDSSEGVLGNQATGGVGGQESASDEGDTGTSQLQRHGRRTWTRATRDRADCNLKVWAL